MLPGKGRSAGVFWYPLDKSPQQGQSVCDLGATSRQYFTTGPHGGRPWSGAVHLPQPHALYSLPPNLEALWACRQNIAVFLQILGSDREGLSIQSQANPDCIRVLHAFFSFYYHWLGFIENTDSESSVPCPLQKREGMSLTESAFLILLLSFSLWQMTKPVWGQFQGAP